MLVGAVLLLVVAGGLAWYLLAPKRDTPPVQTPPPASGDQVEAPPERVAAQPEPIEVKAPPPDAPAIVYPDGSAAEMLNGIEERMALNWPANSEFTPIVGKLRDNGWDWYVHEDGSRSTVIMISYRPGEAERPMGIVAKPTDPLDRIMGPDGKLIDLPRRR